MKIKVWKEGMTDTETKDVAYWERNVLALYVAEGWYNDDVPAPTRQNPDGMMPRYDGWRRVLSIYKGQATFHIPDDFDVGDLEEIRPNWDGHTTEQKWRRMLIALGVKVDD